MKKSTLLMMVVLVTTRIFAYAQKEGTQVVSHRLRRKGQE